VSARRPGRTQKIAYDETVFNAASPNIDARIGWLLAMCRLHHIDETFQDGRHFAQALADAGFPANRSLLSRWESGEIPISYEGMSTYEVALGLEVGQICSVTGYIKASIPGLKTRAVRPKLDPDSRAFAERLGELIDITETGRALARDWQEFGWHLAVAPMVHLRRPVWELLSRRLIAQLPQSIKVSYRQLSTAATNMAAIPQAHDFMVAAIAQYISDPAVQVITTPAGLLDRLPTRQTPRLVLEIIEKPQNSLTYATGTWLATPEGDPPRLRPRRAHRAGHAGAQGLASRPGAGQRGPELIAELPEGTRATPVQAAAEAGRRKLGYVVQHGEELVANRAAQSSHEVADAARAGVPQDPPSDEDRMLTRLIREALFHRDSSVGTWPLLISSSPFGFRGDRRAARPAVQEHLPRVDARPAGHPDPLLQQRHAPAADAAVRRRQVRRRRHLHLAGARPPELQPPIMRSATPSRRHGLRAKGRRCTRWGCPARRASLRSPRPRTRRRGRRRRRRDGGWSRGRRSRLSEGKLMQRVLILQELLAQYRVQFYENLRDNLDSKGIQLSLAHGSATGKRAQLKDEASIPWAERVDNRSLKLAGRQFNLQWPGSLASDADLLIAEHANKHLYNYYRIARRRLGDNRRFALWGHGANLQGSSHESPEARLKKWTASKCDWYFAYTRGSAERVIAAGMPERKVTVVQNSIDTPFYSDLAPLSVPGRCVYIGGLHEHKRIPFLLEAGRLAAHENPGFSLDMIGDGPLSPLVRAEAARSGWLRYYGPLFGKEKAELLKGASLLLMPGLVGLAVIDAFAAETPLITVDARFHSPEIEYLSSANGVLMPSDSDPSDYASSVLDLLANQREIERLRKGCRQSAREYSIERMVTNFAEGIQAALAQPPHSRQ
jgi:glycosyltransferase involved in cell wall biosynthesis